jgi:polar amino acid transport system substrate-binding protein
MIRPRAPWPALLVLAATGWTMSAHAATLTEIRQRGYMVVAVAAEASPFTTLRGGKRTGFDPALLDRLRQSAGFEIRERIVPASALTTTLLAGEVDMIATSLEISAEGEAILAFAPPVAESTLYYLKRRDNDAIKAIADLGGRRLGIRTGSASLPALSELEHNLAKAGNKPLGKIVEFADDDRATRGLKTRKVDYVVDDIVDLVQLAKSHPRIFAVGQPIGRRSYVAWAVAKGNSDLAGFLTAFVLAERSNGDLAALQQKCLGWGFPDLPDSVTAPERGAVRNDRTAGGPAPDFREPD